MKINKPETVQFAPDSILSHLDRVFTGNCKTNDFGRAPPTFSQATVTRLPSEPQMPSRTGNYVYEHQLRIVLAARFWADNFNLGKQVENSERVIAHLLYKDVITQLSEGIGAVMDGDAAAAIEVLSKLRQSLYVW